MVSTATAPATELDRLTRIRNWQSTEFYAALVMRPLCIAVMWLTADWAWLTPNALTTLANACKLAAAALIAFAVDDHAIAAAALLQLGLLFDHLDGTTARYRGACTAAGSFYDKVSDRLGWFAVSAAVGWAGYRATGDGALIALALGSAYALQTVAYMKWLVRAEQDRLAWLEAAPDPQAAVARATRPEPVSVPPRRTARDWAAWAAGKLARAALFEEVDLYFWVGLFVVLGELRSLAYLLAITQAGQLLAMLWVRTRQVREIDTRRRALERAP